MNDPKNVYDRGDEGSLSKDWIVNASPDSFEQDVFEQSRNRPVVVDFWAAWCAPCRMLAPVLEKLADEFRGRFQLVKANTDELPDAAARFQVQGIPAVYGVVNGEVVDFFSGALPEANVRPWLERLLEAGSRLEAERLEAAEPAAAAAKYRELIAASPNDFVAKIGLARVLLEQRQLEECQSLIDELALRGFLEPEAEKIKARLELRKKASADVAARRSAAEADPDNLQLKFALAEALAGQEEYESALDLGLQIVQQDKTGVGEQARQLMVDIFRVLPDESDLARDYRRKLSMALY